MTQKEPPSELKDIEEQITDILYECRTIRGLIVLILMCDALSLICLLFFIIR